MTIAQEVDPSWVLTVGKCSRKWNHDWFGRLDVAPSVARCGVCRSESGRLLVESAGGKWRATELATCKSAWVCGFCSARHQEESAVRAAFHVERRVGRMVLVSLTLPHRWGQPLADLLEVLDAGWRSLAQSVVWKRLEVEGVVKVTHVTISRRFGWHPHLHLLVFLPSSAPSSQELERVIGLRWAKGLGRRGVTPGARAVRVREAETLQEALYPWHYAPEPEDDRYHPDNDWSSWWGDDYREGQDLPDYHPERDSRPVWALATAALNDDKRAARLWDEFYYATKGKSVVQFCRRLCALEAQAEPAADADTGRESLEGAPRCPVALVEARTWNAALRASLADAGLRVGEEHGVEAMARFWGSLLDRPVCVSQVDGLPFVHLQPAETGEEQPCNSARSMLMTRPPPGLRPLVRT